MKIWGAGLIPALLATGCAAPAAPKAEYEPPADGKEMVDRLRVERPSYRPMRNGVEPLSVYIETTPTYYPPLCWDYRRNGYPVSWRHGGYRGYGYGYGYGYGGFGCRYRPAYPVCYKPRW